LTTSTRDQGRGEHRRRVTSSRLRHDLRASAGDMPWAIILVRPAGVCLAGNVRDITQHGTTSHVTPSKGG
jgi:hypothetical protein